MLLEKQFQFSLKMSKYSFHKLEMDPEIKTFAFLGSCGIFLKEQVQIFPEKKQLAVIKKWHSLAHNCLKLWNEYSAVYTLRSRCPLCEPNLKTVSLRTFDRYRCLADVAVVNLKRVPRNFQGTSCTTKEPQIRNIESVLRLPKNAKTTLKLLSKEGPGLLQCSNHTYKKDLNRIKFSTLKLNYDPIWHLKVS